MTSGSETTSLENRAENTAGLQWGWVAAALIAHTSWGAYSVLARYLQTISQLPSLSILTLATMPPLLVVFPLYYRKIDWQKLRSPLVWLFLLTVVVRALTNLFAARFTLSIYVQLINQTTPFMVVLLAATIFKEQIPRYTGWAIAACTAGAILMMGNNVGLADAAVSRQDWLGIGLALLSSLSLAVYMLLVSRAGRDRVSSELMFVVQLITIMIVTAPLSWAFGEDWSRWLEITPTDWLIFFAFSLLVYLMANLLQIMSIQQIGASLVSTIMAWRLVSALVLGALILGERLESWWQILGAVIVLVTVTWYLSLQR